MENGGYELRITISLVGGFIAGIRILSKFIQNLFFNNLNKLEEKSEQMHATVYIYRRFWFSLALDFFIFHFS